jgi:hypothetical protein
VAELDHRPPRDNPEVSHERSDVNVRAILVFGIGLLVVAVVIHIALYWLLAVYRNTSARQEPAANPLRAENQVPPEPRLQVSPRDDLAAMRTAEDKELYNYGWVDKEKKVARIPIDRAMELIAERGLPSRKEGLKVPSSPAGASGRKDPQTKETKR